MTLAGKRKANKGSRKGLNPKDEKKKKVLSKIKCYGYHKFGHYVSGFPQRKKNEKKGKKQTIAPTSVDELSSRIEDEFALIAYLTSSTSLGVWYINSGASFHMIGTREYFSSYKEEDIRIQISMGNNSKLSLVGKGIILFQRENGKSIPIRDVLHVPDLGMNLILVFVLQDKGYNVLFRGVHVLIKNKDLKSPIVIGVRSD